jgi:hypothetical protein
MLDLPRYLLGVAEIALLGGFATLGASALRSRLLPAFEGTPAHLATAVIALAMLIVTAEILGVVGLFEPAPYLIANTMVGAGVWLGVGGRQGGPSRLLGFSPGERQPVREARQGEKQDAAAREGPPYPPPVAQTLVALAIAGMAVVKFGLETKTRLSTGMTGFDSTWYHGPFAAGYFQSGNTWDLHLIAPQFLAWFYPANAEIFHATGMLAFGRDILSPLLNLGWLAGCLVACWCIGRPYRVAPWSLALGAVALSLPLLSDQAGEARNDIVGIFFLLAAVAVALNGRATRRDEQVGLATGAVLVAGLAAGLAAGTKLNFLLPAAVLVLGLAFVAPHGRHWRGLAAAALAALLGGGYWYLRNLVHSGNPLPWFDSIGPISLPAPDQALGGRQAHSVLGYVSGGAVWSDWFLPGLHDGLTVAWPLLGAGAAAGLLLCLGRRSDPLLRVAGALGLAAALAWLAAPTSASGLEGVPRGFESGLRYLAPALVLGLAILPATPPLRRLLGRAASTSLSFPAHIAGKDRLVGRRVIAWLAAVVVLLAVAVGYPVQRHYLEGRYANPSFAAPGLNAVFAWATPISNARIATTSTRQYPLYGTDLSNHVQYIGEEQPHGGFTAPATCRRWRQLLNAGKYDYVIATRDRIEPGKPTYPAAAKWTAGPAATVVLRKPPTVVFQLKAPLDPSACPSR